MTQDNNPFSKFKLNPKIVDIQHKLSTFTEAALSSDKTDEKELFIQSITVLDDINSMSEDLLDLGIDLFMFEDLYRSVIFNLFNLLYTPTQVELIGRYLAQLDETFDEDEPLDAIYGKNGETLEPDTPEELWIALQLLR